MSDQDTQMRDALAELTDTAKKTLARLSRDVATALRELARPNLDAETMRAGLIFVATRADRAADQIDPQKVTPITRARNRRERRAQKSNRP